MTESPAPETSIISPVDAQNDGLPAGSGYALLDAGDERRLERFGRLVVDRPAPGATDPRLAPARWRAADLRFEAGRGWSAPAAAEPVEPWEVTIAGLRMELRGTSSGGVGLYPEHAANLGWLEGRIRSAAPHTEAAGPQVLNLFGHTGLATLALARAGAAVTHVDAARSAIAWARRNAERNGLSDRPVRWLVDEAAAFVAREARRGRRYEGIVLDPPTVGRSGRRQWLLRDDLPRLLAACRAVAHDDAWLLLTAHTTGLDGDQLRELVEGSFSRRSRDPWDVEPMLLVAESGARLALGWAVRVG